MRPLRYSCCKVFLWMLKWSVDKLCSWVTKSEDHIGCSSHFIVACFNNCKNFNDTGLSWGLLLLYCPHPPASRGCTSCNVVEFIGAKMWFQDNPDCRYSSHLIQKNFSGFKFWFYSQKYFWYNLGQFLHFRYNLFKSNLHFYWHSVLRTIKRSIWFNSTYWSSILGMAHFYPQNTLFTVWFLCEKAFEILVDI